MSFTAAASDGREYSCSRPFLSFERPELLQKVFMFALIFQAIHDIFYL
jgi:hypothetical protein